MYTIYCHIFPNGKRYIGLTRTRPETRWGGQGQNYKTCLLVNRAIEKYGWDNVRHVILFQTEKKQDAEDMERLYISLFDTTDPEKGYNILPGGDVATNDATPEMREKLGRGMRGKHHSEEDKKKISEGVKRSIANGTMPVHKGWKHKEEWFETISEKQKATWTPERRAKMSEYMKKRFEDPEYRKSQKEHLDKIRKLIKPRPLTEEQKAQISARSKGKFVGGKSPQAAAIDQYTKDGQFVRRWDSMRDAERAGLGAVSNLSKACLKKPHHHTVKGFVWRYAGEPF